MCKGIGDLLNIQVFLYSAIIIHAGSCNSTGSCTCTEGWGGPECENGQYRNMYEVQITRLITLLIIADQSWIQGVGDGVITPPPPTPDP